MTARTPAEAIAAVHRFGPPLTGDQRAAAVALLTDMLAATAPHGVGLDDFDFVADLPAACVHVVAAKTRNG